MLNDVALWYFRTNKGHFLGKILSLQIQRYKSEPHHLKLIIVSYHPLS